MSGTGILTNDSDADGDTLTVAKVNGATVAVGQTVTLPNGKVKVNGNGTFTYVPKATFVGMESFTYVGDRRRRGEQPGHGDHRHHVTLRR